MNSHPHRPENNAGRISIPLHVGAWMAGAVLVTLLFQKAITAYTGDTRTPPQATVRGPNPSVHNFNQPRKAISLDIATADRLLPLADPKFPLWYEPEIPVQASPAPRTAATQENQVEVPSLTCQEQKQLGSKVDYEANRLLRMLTEKYDLTPAQQAQVFPIIARATPSAAQLAAATGNSLTEPSLSVLDISIKPTDRTYESAADSVSATTDSPLLAKNVSEDPAATRTPRKLAPSSDPLDEIEAQLAPFLDPDQLATMDPDQIDRFYWWGEILIQVSGEIEDDAAIAAAALGSGAGTSSASDSSASSADAADSSVVPAAHQDGTLFDLIGLP
jgi:hypothetical protein